MRGVCWAVVRSGWGVLVEGESTPCFSDRWCRSSACSQATRSPRQPCSPCTDHRRALPVFIPPPHPRVKNGQQAELRVQCWIAVPSRS
eukprot:2279277-Rhodomonas_salina.1